MEYGYARHGTIVCTEPVYALILIAHHEYPVGLPCKHSDDLTLNVGRVLHLIDADILVSEGGLDS